MKGHIAVAVAALAAAFCGPAMAEDGFTAELRATIQFDTVALDSSNLPSTDHISSGASFRRIRIGVAGHLSQDWTYEFTPKLEVSSSNRIAINNAFVQYDGWAPLHLRIGAQSPPANFDDATSSAELLFLERAQPDDLGRNIGGGTGRDAITLFAYDDSYFASLSYSGGAANDAVLRQQGLVGRAAWRVWHDAESNLAIGANLTHLLALPRDGAAHDARLRERPELDVQTVDLHLVDTGDIDAHSVTAFGLEAAGNRGNLYAQGGFTHYAIDRADPAVSDPSFSGWYMQASWLLTGEAKPWRSNKGGYGAPLIAHPMDGDGFGALELAARYSDLDLDYRAGLAGKPGPADTVRGGKQRIATVGLNWYPLDKVRFLLDYSHVDAPRLSVNGRNRDGSADLVALRSQLAF